eukprot:jgi/Mesvir1/2878/Mv13957-RA.1
MSAGSPRADSGEEGTHLPPVVNNSGGEGNRQGGRSYERKYNLRGGNSQYSVGAERGGPYTVPVITQQGMLRSVTLLNDLQAYIQSVESLAAQRKAEVELLLQEKKDNDRMHRLVDRSKSVNLHVSSADENSPQVRALVEDNKVMKDRVRKYKDRCRELERANGSLTSQNLKLADKVKELTRTLEECSRTPAMVAEEKEHEGQLKEKDATIKDLEWKLAVAEKSREAEAKKGRAQQAGHAKEVESLQGQISALKKTLEDKEKEVRADHLKIKLLKKKVEEGARTKPPTDAASGDSSGANDADVSLLSPLNAGGGGGVDHWGGSSGTPMSWNPVTLQIVVQQVKGCDGSCACGGLEAYDDAPKSPERRDVADSGAALGQGAVSMGGPAGLDTDEFVESPPRASPPVAAVPALPSPPPRRVAVDGDAGTAAMRIQATFRGHRVRKKTNTQRTAAVKVQAAFRGHRVRKQAAEKGLYSLTRGAAEGAKPGAADPLAWDGQNSPGRGTGRSAIDSRSLRGSSDQGSALSPTGGRKPSTVSGLSVNPGKGVPPKDSPTTSPKGPAGGKQPWVQPTVTKNAVRMSLSKSPSMMRSGSIKR